MWLDKISNLGPLALELDVLLTALCGPAKSGFESMSSNKAIYRQISKEYPVDPFLSSGLVHPYNMDESIPSFRGFWWVFSCLLHFPQKFLLANSVDPD